MTRGPTEDYQDFTAKPHSSTTFISHFLSIDSLFQLLFENIYSPEIGFYLRRNR